MPRDPLPPRRLWLADLALALLVAAALVVIARTALTTTLALPVYLGPAPGCC